MIRLRCVLAPIAAAWLLCQVSILIAAPVAFWVASAEELNECTCAHGDHAICPMHHKPAPGSKICLMRSSDSRDAAVLSSIFGAVGLLPAPALITAPIPVQFVVRVEGTTTSLRPAAPEPPPPRA